MHSEYYSNLIVRLFIATILLSYASYCWYDGRVLVPGLASHGEITASYPLGVAALFVLGGLMVASCLFYDFFARNRIVSVIAIVTSACLMAVALVLG